MIFRTDIHLILEYNSYECLLEVHKETKDCARN